jgi:hypothetical protein
MSLGSLASAVAVDVSLMAGSDRGFGMKKICGNYECLRYVPQAHFVNFFTK